MRTRPQLIDVPCRRGCGRTVTTLTRSISGAHETHAKYSGICNHCIKPEELEEIERATTAAMLHRCRTEAA